MYRGQTQFRPPTWQLIAVILVDVGASAGALLYWNAFGIDWVFGGLVLVAVVAGAGIFEVLTTGVALGESEMQVRQRGRHAELLRRRRHHFRHVELLHHVLPQLPCTQSPTAMSYNFMGITPDK